MATNNTTENQVLALFPDNSLNEISAEDMRTYVGAIFGDKEVTINKIDLLQNLSASNSTIYEGSLVIIWNDSFDRRGIYLSIINQPVVETDLIKLSALAKDYMFVVPTETITITTSGGISTAYLVTFVDATIEDIVATLPTAADNKDKIINIKRIDTSSNIVTINTYNNETIDSFTTADLRKFDNIQVVSNGTNWYLI